MSGQFVVVLLECLRDRGVGGASEGLGVLQRGPLGITEQPRLPPRGETVDLRLRNPDVAGGAVVDLEAVGAVVDLGDAQSQQLSSWPSSVSSAV